MPVPRGVKWLFNRNFPSSSEGITEPDSNLIPNSIGILRSRSRESWSIFIENPLESKNPISSSNFIGLSISWYAFNWKWESTSSWTLYICPICPWSGLPGSTISKFSKRTFSLYISSCSKLILSLGSPSMVNTLVSASQETTLPLWFCNTVPLENDPTTSPRISLELKYPTGTLLYLKPLSFISTSNILPISLVKEINSAKLPFLLVTVSFGNLE